MNNKLKIFSCLSILVFSGVFFFCNYNIVSATAWYSTGGTWLARKPIVIDHTKVGVGTTTPLVNFPILVSVTDVDLKSTGSGGYVASSTGDDIIFTDDTGTALLNYEIESYTSTSGKLVAWVKIPSLSPLVDTTIYMYFGNASAPGNTSANAQGTWNSNFKSVYHLNGSTLSANDSTSNVSNGTLVNSPTSTTGVIDRGASFSAASSQSITSNTILGRTAFSSGTYCLWAYSLNAYNDNAKNIMFGQLDNGTGEEFVGMKWDNNNIYFGWRTSAGGDKRIVLPATALNWPQNSWNQYCISWTDGGTTRLYMNAVEIGTNTNTPVSVNPGTNPLSLATEPGSGAYWNGKLDEMNLSDVVLSPDWITTGYRNQNVPSTFSQEGTLETNIIAVSLTAPADGATVSGSSVSLSATTFSINSSIAGVKFYLDGMTQQIGPELTTETSSNVYSTVWDTTILSNGIHSLIAVARDLTAHVATSSSATATVSNAPGTPTSVTASSGNTTATISFTAPASNSISPVTSYGIYNSSTNTVVTTTTTTSAFLSGLTNGVLYSYYVTALNSGGESAPSSVISVIPTTVPNPPTSVLALAGNTTASVYFTPPVDNGGSVITSYTVTSNPGSFTSTGSASPLTVTGLTNGTDYTFTVRATNAVGTSSSSVASPVATPLASVPSVPLSFSATGGNGQISLSWLPPADTGGSPITQYSISYKQFSESTYTVSTSSSVETSKVLTGLSNGVSYDVQIVAQNVIGSSTPSALSVSLASLTSSGGAPLITSSGSAPSIKYGSRFILTPLGLQANNTPTFQNPPQTQTQQPSKVSSQFQFTRSLWYGEFSPEVAELQKYLNSHGYIVSTKGSGSPGHEINLFGSGTLKALKKFQKDNGISPAEGYFGTITKRFINTSSTTKIRNTQ
jgi:hypothetical protein